jgi:hypothetical protein
VKEFKKIIPSQDRWHATWSPSTQEADSRTPCAQEFEARLGNIETLNPKQNKNPRLLQNYSNNL